MANEIYTILSVYIHGWRPRSFRILHKLNPNTKNPNTVAIGKRNPTDKALNSSLDISPDSEPVQELYSRAAPSVEAHHHVNGSDTGSNSGGRQTIKKVKKRLYQICSCHSVHLNELNVELSDQVRRKNVFDCVILLRFALDYDQRKSSESWIVLLKDKNESWQNWKGLIIPRNRKG